MPASNRDDKNPPGSTAPQKDQQEPTTAKPDAAATLLETPTPKVIVNPRIKNN